MGNVWPFTEQEYKDGYRTDPRLWIAEDPADPNKHIPCGYWRKGWILGGSIDVNVNLLGNIWSSGVDDDFSDSDRSFTLLWVPVEDGWGTIDVDGGWLRYILGEWGGAYAGTLYCYSKFLMVGDFDIQIDFDATLWPTLGENHIIDLDFQLRDAATGTFTACGWWSYYLDFTDPITSERLYYRRTYEGGDGGNDNNHLTSHRSGTFRIVRTDGNVYLYYLDGTWQQIAPAFSFPNSVYIDIYQLWGGYSAPCYIYWDNFRVNWADEIILL